MTRALGKFRQAIRGEVASVTAMVQFHSVERLGAVGAISIKIAADKYWFGCAGDGGVAAVWNPAPTGDAPGFVTEPRLIENLGGILEKVFQSANELEITIAGNKLVLRNLDDELSVLLNGAPLPEKTLLR